MEDTATAAARERRSGVSSVLGAKVSGAGVAVIVAGFLPAAWLGLRALRGDLGANPIETVTHFTGDWTLRFLLLTLAVTPLRRISGWNAVISHRRTLGLFAFFYASLHFLTWIGVDHFLDWMEMRDDILKRPYITAGFTGFACMV